MIKRIAFLILSMSVVVFGPVHRADAKERQGSVTFQVNLDAPADANNIRLWIPYPVSDRSQENKGERIMLNPQQSGGPLLYFMYPYVEADGKPLNEDLYGFNIGYKITFKEQ